jgi:hypothetical protein
MCGFFTQANLRKDAGRPNTLRTLFNIETGSFAKQPWDIKIRDEEDRPLWLVHPKRSIDIAVLPLPPPPPDLIVALYPLNVLANTKLRIEIGMEVFILCYRDTGNFQTGRSAWGCAGPADKLPLTVPMTRSKFDLEICYAAPARTRPRSC